MNAFKKVGIMGGTFNPIHMGHLIIAENAREFFDLDEILFVPSGIPYMKEHVLDSKTRISMTGIAIEDNPYFALSTIEVDRGGNSYSYETIQDLQKQNPTTKYYFIVGADSLFSMDKWKHPDKIFQECTVLAAIREGHNIEELTKQANLLKDKYECDIQFIPARSVDISSTNIRDRVREKRSIRYMVHDKVLNFIHKNKLYIEEDIKDETK